MNPLQRFQSRMNGQPVDRIPNFDIMMTFAAHYIRQPLSRYYLDHQVLVDANLAVLEDFHLDIVQAISDPYREAADFGLEVEFPYDNLPMSRAPLLEEPEDLARLKNTTSGFGKRMNDRLEAISLFHEKIGDEVPIMGWVEGGLAEAADLRGINQILMDVCDQPEWVEELVEFCTKKAIEFTRAQVVAGANIIGIGDAICSQISPEMYKQFALPYEKRIFTAVHELGAVGRLHICGNTTSLITEMAHSGADIIDFDWMVDLGRAAQVCGDKIAVCGNFDPVCVMLQGTPEIVSQSVRECAAQAGIRSLSAAGCEIPDTTPPENLMAQYQTLCELV